MIRCLIVDDEAPARQRLARLLGADDDVEIAGEAGDGASALEQIAALRPDVVFLDIDMPALDGLGVAAALGASGPAIVFVTAFDEHALRAFELSAIDYLVKPVAQERLDAALAKLRSRRGGSAPDLGELAFRVVVAVISRAVGPGFADLRAELVFVDRDAESRFREDGAMAIGDRRKRLRE